MDKTIRIGDIQVPMPLRAEPPTGNSIWVVSLTNPDLVFPDVWTGSRGQRDWLARGLLHTTEMNARAHAVALLGLMKKGE